MKGSYCGDLENGDKQNLDMKCSPFRSGRNRLNVLGASLERSDLSI